MASAAEPAVRKALATMCRPCSQQMMRRLASRTVPRRLYAASANSPRRSTVVAATETATPTPRCSNHSSRSTPLTACSHGPRQTSAFSSQASAAATSDAPQKRVLGADDLFHPFTSSPIPEIRKRAAYIRQHAYCPHPDHRMARIQD
ncbi:hypothetical protein MAPG_03313, partial [Magnaporthiopsis poae ATCC 64411]